MAPFTQEAGERQREHQPERKHRRQRAWRQPGEEQELDASALQQVDVLQVHRLVVPEDREDDRQPHRRLGRRDRHHEEDEDLARRRRGTWASATKVRFTALSISSTHMKITIALRRSSTPSDADAEEDRREGERRAEQSGHQILRFASTTAPDDRGQEQDRGRPRTAPGRRGTAARRRRRTTLCRRGRRPGSRRGERRRRRPAGAPAPAAPACSATARTSSPRAAPRHRHRAADAQASPARSVVGDVRG